MNKIIIGDCREIIFALPAASVQCVVTSPPYYGPRDYKVDGQIGQEPTPAEYVDALVVTFRAVRHALKDDGTVWLNLGDSWSSKQLLGIPWRVAFALQADGWYLRSEIIWAKDNPMPESVKDRPTKSHEHIFLLSKSEAYYYDQAAVLEPLASAPSVTDPGAASRYAEQSGRNDGGTRVRTGYFNAKDGRNMRDVWNITPRPFGGEHFATFPPELPQRCIRAGSKTGDLILDPFGGAGTTGVVAEGESRRFVLCELNPKYANIARERIGMFCQMEEYRGGPLTLDQ